MQKRQVYWTFVTYVCTQVVFLNLKKCKIEINIMKISDRQYSANLKINHVFHGD